MKSKITPVQFWNDSATTLFIESVKITSFGDKGTAVILWCLLNDNEKRLSNDAMTIKDTDYSVWGTNDNYILELVASKLNLTLIE